MSHRGVFRYRVVTLPGPDCSGVRRRPCLSGPGSENPPCHSPSTPQVSVCGLKLQPPVLRAHDDMGRLAPGVMVLASRRPLRFYPNLLPARSAYSQGGALAGCSRGRDTSISALSWGGLLLAPGGERYRLIFTRWGISCNRYCVSVPRLWDSGYRLFPCSIPWLRGCRQPWNARTEERTTN